MGMIYEDDVPGEISLVQRMWTARCDAEVTFTSAVKPSTLISFAIPGPGAGTRAWTGVGGCQRSPPAAMPSRRPSTLARTGRGRNAERIALVWHRLGEAQMAWFWRWGPCEWSNLDRASLPAPSVLSWSMTVYPVR